MVRTRRTKGGFQPAQLRSTLQEHRDNIASTLPSSWLTRGHYSIAPDPNKPPPKKKPTAAKKKKGREKKEVADDSKTTDDKKIEKRPDARSRGIENTTIPNAYRCYQSAVYQSMMHQPIFLNWILSHNEPADPQHRRRRCAKCDMKALVRFYWGPTPPTIPVPHDARMLLDLQRIVQDHWSGDYIEGNYADAGNFYDELIRELGDTTDPQWRDEFEAIYRLDKSAMLRCTNCNHRREGPVAIEYSMNIRFDITMTTLEQTFNNYFNDVVQVDCPSCNVGLVDHERTETIEAGPQVLRIRLVIFDGHRIQGQDVTFKKFRALNIPEGLDLTEHQSVSNLALRYKLNSVIAHGGNGGMVPGNDGPPPEQLIIPTDLESENEEDSELDNENENEEVSDEEDDAEQQEEPTSRSKSKNKAQNQRAKAPAPRTTKGKGKETRRVAQGKNEGEKENTSSNQRSSVGSQRNNKRKYQEDEEEEEEARGKSGSSSLQSFMTSNDFLDPFNEDDFGTPDESPVVDVSWSDNASVRSHSPAGEHSPLVNYPRAERAQLRGGGPKRERKTYTTRTVPASQASSQKTKEPAPKKRRQTQSSKDNVKDKAKEVVDKNMAFKSPYYGASVKDMNKFVNKTLYNDGHYIASVRGQKSKFYRINDDDVEDIDHDTLLENPMRPPQGDPAFRPRGYQVYVLTYLRQPGQAKGKRNQLEGLVTTFI